MAADGDEADGAGVGATGAPGGVGVGATGELGGAGAGAPGGDGDCAWPRDDHTSRAAAISAPGRDAARRTERPTAREHTLPGRSFVALLWAPRVRDQRRGRAPSTPRATTVSAPASRRTG
ncbi:MAG: hypothetical protein EOO75_20085, partial [Myxococcales bacterium]